MRIVSFLRYEGKRLMTMVELEDGTTIPMYRSSGSAGPKDSWLPFAGVMMRKEDCTKDDYDSQLYPFEKWFNNDSGWIVKMGLIIYPNGSGTLLQTTSGGDHRNPDDRLSFVLSEHTKLFREVSNFLKNTLGDIPVESFISVTGLGVNMWLKEHIKEKKEQAQ